MAVFVKCFHLKHVCALFGGPHIIILFFQYSLTFNIISLTFYYSSNKKITTKQNFSFFYTKHSYFFTFKKKNILTFFHICYSVKPKPNENRLPNEPHNVIVTLLLLFYDLFTNMSVIWVRETVI